MRKRRFGMGQNDKPKQKATLAASFRTVLQELHEFTLKSKHHENRRGAMNTARQSRNLNGRGEPRNTRNTRKEGGESLSFLFRVFRVFSGSVRS